MGFRKTDRQSLGMERWLPRGKKSEDGDEGKEK